MPLTTTDDVISYVRTHWRPNLAAHCVQLVESSRSTKLTEDEIFRIFVRAYTLDRMSRIPQVALAHLKRNHMFRHA